MAVATTESGRSSAGSLGTHKPAELPDVVLPAKDHGSIRQPFKRPWGEELCGVIPAVRTWIVRREDIQGVGCRGLQHLVDKIGKNRMVCDLACAKVSLSEVQIRVDD
jgi:hypothetical protein